MSNYTVINPKISGDFKSTFEADTAIEAANMFWNEQSKYIIGSEPRFGFSLQKSGSDTLHHFYVVEKVVRKDGDEQVQYKVEDITNEVTPEAEMAMLERIGNISGGRRRRRYSHSLDENEYLYDDLDAMSDNNYTYHIPGPVQVPIIGWRYYPTVYNFRTLFPPVFVKSIAPKMEILL